jgi:hypothetical protein
LAHPSNYFNYVRNCIMLLPVFIFGFIGLVFGSALVSRVETGELTSSASVGMNEELVATGDIASSSSEVNKKLFRFMKAVYNGDIQVAEKLIHDYPSVFMPFKKSFVDEFLNPLSSHIPKKLIKRKPVNIHTCPSHLQSTFKSLLSLHGEERVGYVEGRGFVSITPSKAHKSGFAVLFIPTPKDILAMAESYLKEQLPLRAIRDVSQEDSSSVIEEVASLSEKKRFESLNRCLDLCDIVLHKADSIINIIKDFRYDFNSKDVPSVPSKKDILLRAIENGEFESAEELVHGTPSLLDHFDSEIFEKFLNLLNKDGSYLVCSSYEHFYFFKLLEPSFHKLSSSKTSPLILSIHLENVLVFKALLELPIAQSIVEFIDEDGRTALIHACMQGNFYYIARLIPLSKQVLEVKDSINQMTALHYLCILPHDSDDENYIAEQKHFMLQLFLKHGATITLDSPEYVISSVDKDFFNLFYQKLTDLNFPAMYVSLFILFFGGECFVNSKWPSLTIYAIKNPLIDLLNHIASSILSYNNPNTEYSLGAVVQTEDSCIPVNLTWTFMAFTLLVIHLCVMSFLKS